MKPNLKIISSVFILIALFLVTAFSIAETKKPEVKIEPANTRVVYSGVKNPFLISAPGFASNDLVVKATGAEVMKGPGQDKYLIEPAGSQMVYVTVNAKSGNGYKIIATDSFRVKDIQNPVFYFGSHAGDCTMSQDEIRNELGVFSRMVNCDFDGTFKITSFSMSIYSNETWKESTTDGPSFTDEQKIDLAALQSGDRIIFHHINVRGFSEITRTIPGMYVTVQ